MNAIYPANFHLHGSFWSLEGHSNAIVEREEAPYTLEAVFPLCHYLPASVHHQLQCLKCNKAQGWVLGSCTEISGWKFALSVGVVNCSSMARTCYIVQT